MSTRRTPRSTTKAGSEKTPPQREGRPSPAALARFGNPASRVTPVDYTATGHAVKPDSTVKPGPVPGPRSAAQPGPDPAAGAGPVTGAGSATQRGQAPSHAPVPRRKPERFELVPQSGPAPDDAVVTINPSDPRPYTRPLVVAEEEIRTVSGPSFARITHEVIVLTVADPEDAWSADNGTSDHYMRGSWTVQVRRADNHVIGAFPSGYALAVRPEGALDVDPAELAGPSNRRKKGTRHPGDVRALKKRLEEHGFVVSSSGSTHGKVTHPDFPGLFTPWASTPSDRRHPQMVTAQVKRVFGIDIRHGAG